MLLHFLFLHQTATSPVYCPREESCYISCFYIKPQPTYNQYGTQVSCYISCFYIKPQPKLEKPVYNPVATFLVSTSNRNGTAYAIPDFKVATFLVSTSNRNWRNARPFSVQLLHFLFLHQTATWFRGICWLPGCYISCFYIKPQRWGHDHRQNVGCYISCFYIKPQLFWYDKINCLGCYISCFYIKPQPISITYRSQAGCYISCFYIKPQLISLNWGSVYCCYISCFYIKPQL